MIIGRSGRSAIIIPAIGANCTNVKLIWKPIAYIYNPYRGRYNTTPRLARTEPIKSITPLMISLIKSLVVCIALNNILIGESNVFSTSKMAVIGLKALLRVSIPKLIAAIATFARSPIIGTFLIEPGTLAFGTTNSILVILSNNVVIVSSID